MTHPVDELDRQSFADALERVLGESLDLRVTAALHQHYLELLRWAPKVDLVGPAVFDELFERHYGESLAGRPLLPESGTLVDLGSGAGFPGFVLAAARPDLEVYLVEPRVRRAAFLAAAVRRAGLACHCLDAKVDPSLSLELPARIDVVTVRALRLPAKVWAALAARLSPGGRVLVWAGPTSDRLPPPWFAGRRIALPRGHREIVEYRLSEKR